MIRTHIYRCYFSAVLAIAALAVNSLAITGPEILSATGIKSGLCVHVGVGDGTITAGLDNNGRILVHGLAMSDQELANARRIVSAAGKDGVVTIQLPIVTGKLPYAQYLVDLIVADMDALGSKAPSMEELKRAARPQGVLYLKKGGVWTKTITPAVSGMDSEWRFEEGNEQRTNLSQDRIAGPATSLQWIADYGWLHGNHGPNVRGARLSAGRVFYHAFTDKLGRTRYMHGRNAFNGVSLWKHQDGAMHLHSTLVPVGDRMYTVLQNGRKGFSPTETVVFGGPLVALNAESGEQVMAFDKAGKADGFGQSMSPIVWKGTLYLINRDTLFAFDESSGALKWTWTEGPWRRPSRPVIDPDHEQIIMTIGPNSVGDGGGWFAGRWPNSAFDLIVAIGFDGKVRWRNTSVSSDPGKWDVLFSSKGSRGENTKGVWDTTVNYGKKNAAGVAYADNKFFLAMLIDGEEFGSVAAVSAIDGKLLWHNIAGNSYYAPLQLTYRNGVLYKVHYNCIIAMDPNTGAKIGPSAQNLLAKSDVTGDDWANCSRSTFTPTYIITSSSAFIRNDHSWIRQYVHRGNCSQQGYPGNGMVYYPMGACGCATYERGFAALSSETIEPAIDDALRLVRGEAYSQSVSGSGTFRNSARWGLATYSLENPSVERDTMAPLRLPPVKTGQPLQDDWVSNDVFFVKEQSVSDNEGRTYTSKIHQHTVEAKSGDKVIWTYHTDGRVSGAPLISDGRCFIAAHDGWVYCLRASDGKLIWKFMAAPYEHNIVAYSQVESAWPVYGVVLHNGALFTSAGRHPELNGGIWLYRLDPKTGTMAWKSVLRRNAIWRINGTKGPYREPGDYASVKNVVPVIINNQLAIKTARFDLGTGKMAPHINPEFVNVPFTGSLVSTKWEEFSKRNDIPVRLTDKAFWVAASCYAEVSVFDLKGRQVAVLFSGMVREGTYGYTLRNQGLVAGRYNVRLKIGDFGQVKSVVVR